MKMKDAKNNQDVYCYLFTDMFLITKASKRNISTNSSSTLTNIDGQYLRSSTNILNKILRLPIRIDRFDVKEYDRRTGNSEPNTVKIEFYLIEYLAIHFFSLYLLLGIICWFSFFGIQSY